MSLFGGSHEGLVTLCLLQMQAKVQAQGIVCTRPVAEKGSRAGGGGAGVRGCQPL